MRIQISLPMKKFRRGGEEEGTDRQVSTTGNPQNMPLNVYFNIGQLLLIQKI